MPKSNSRSRTKKESILRRRKIDLILQQGADTSTQDLRTVLEGTSSVNTTRDPSVQPPSTQIGSPNSHVSRPTESVEERFPTLSRTADFLRTAKHGKRRRRKRWGGPRSTPSCVLHPKDNGHRVDQCPTLLEQPAHTRLETLRRIRCCESCAGLHSTSECRVLSECELCAGDHLTILHQPTSESPPQNQWPLVPVGEPPRESPSPEQDREGASPPPTDHRRVNRVGRLLSELHESIARFDNTMEAAKEELASCSPHGIAECLINLAGKLMYLKQAGDQYRSFLHESNLHCVADWYGFYYTEKMNKAAQLQQQLATRRELLMFYEHGPF